MPANPAVLIAPAPLSAKEVAELERTERVIEQAERGWCDLGAGLRLIREQRLYRGPAGKQTWEAYCLERWEYSHDRAEQFIRAAAILDGLKSSRQFVVLPARESHVRMLTYLESADWPRAWARTLELAGRRRVTAKHVEAACTEVLGRPPGAAPGEVSPDLMRILDSLSPEARHEFFAEAEAAAQKSAAQRVQATAADRWAKLESGWSRWVAKIDRRAGDDDLRQLWRQVWESEAFRRAWAALEQKLKGGA